MDCSRGYSPAAGPGWWQSVCGTHDGQGRLWVVPPTRASAPTCSFGARRSNRWCAHQ